MVSVRAHEYVGGLSARIVVALFFASAAICPHPVIAADYHFDSVAGNDTTGTGATGAPWQTLSMLGTVQLAPGDRVRLARGSLFRERLSIAASGSVAAPIVVEAYGAGSDPVISAGHVIPQGAAWTDIDGDGEYRLELGSYGRLLHEHPGARSWSAGGYRDLSSCSKSPSTGTTDRGPVLQRERGWTCASCTTDLRRVNSPPTSSSRSRSGVLRSASRGTGSRYETSPGCWATSAVRTFDPPIVDGTISRRRRARVRHRLSGRLRS